MHVYIATSWKNDRYEAVKAVVESAGHIVLDWRKNPAPMGVTGTTQGTWKLADQRFQDAADSDSWTAELAREALQHDAALRVYHHDSGLIMQADVMILLSPCGRSAHFEAGIAEGRRMPRAIYHADGAEPELMACGLDQIVNDEELVAWLASAERRVFEEGSTQGRDMNAAMVALDSIADVCGCPHWEYPGQVVRDVIALAGELHKRRVQAGDREVPSLYKVLGDDPQDTEDAPLRRAEVYRRGVVAMARAIGYDPDGRDDGTDVVCLDVTTHKLQEWAAHRAGLMKAALDLYFEEGPGAQSDFWSVDIKAVERWYLDGAPSGDPRAVITRAAARELLSSMGVNGLNADAVAFLSGVVDRVALHGCTVEELAALVRVAVDSGIAKR